MAVVCALEHFVRLLVYIYKVLLVPPSVPTLVFLRVALPGAGDFSCPFL